MTANLSAAPITETIPPLSLDAIHPVSAALIDWLEHRDERHRFVLAVYRSAAAISEDYAGGPWAIASLTGAPVMLPAAQRHCRAGETLLTPCVLGAAATVRTLRLFARTRRIPAYDLMLRRLEASLRKVPARDIIHQLASVPRRT